MLKIWVNKKAASRLMKCKTAAPIVEGIGHQLM